MGDCWELELIDLNWINNSNSTLSFLTMASPLNPPSRSPNFVWSNLAWFINSTYLSCRISFPLGSQNSGSPFRNRGWNSCLNLSTPCLISVAFSNYALCIMLYFSITFLAATRTIVLLVIARVTKSGPSTILRKLNMAFWAFSLGFFCIFYSKTLHLPPADVEARSCSSIMIKYLLNVATSAMSSSQSMCLAPILTGHSPTEWF